MRTFRNTAIAAATAVSLTFAGTTIASAQEGQDEVRFSSGSSALGHDLDAWDMDEDGNPVITDDNQISGEDGLGDETAAAEDTPQWFESWKNLTTLGIVGSVVGAIIGGINWLKFQGILPA